MNDLKLRAVLVCAFNEGSEFHEVGFNKVTKIEWGSFNGHMAALPSVRVYKGEALYSEHPFSNVLGVYYAAPETGDGR